MKTGVNILEFTRTPKSLKVTEEAINRQLKDKFPQVGPVKLLQTEDGQVGVRMTMTVSPGKKGLLDEVYQFVMQLLGGAKGRRPGEKKIQAKYHIPEQLHRQIQIEAKRAHVSASDLVVSCLKKTFHVE